MVQQARREAPRERLIAAAAEALETCRASRVRGGHEQDHAQNRPAARLRFWRSWRPRRPRSSSTGSRALKRPDQYKFIGQAARALDVPLKNQTAPRNTALIWMCPAWWAAAIIKCPVFRRHGEIGRRRRDRRGGAAVLQVVKLKNAVRGRGGPFTSGRRRRSMRCRSSGRSVLAGNHPQRAVPQGISRCPRPEGARKRATTANVDAAMADGRQGDRGDLRRADHRARADGAAQTPSRMYKPIVSTFGSARRTADPGAGVRRAGLRGEAGECLRPQHVLWRRLRPAGWVLMKLPRRLRSPRRVGKPVEADLDARGGNSAGSLPHAGRDPFQRQGLRPMETPTALDMRNLRGQPPNPGGRA